MKALTTLICLILCSTTSWASIEDPMGGLEFVGFSYEGTLNGSEHLRFQDEIDYYISQEGMTDYSQAKSFCQAFEGTHLAYVEHVLLLAMSGATNFVPFLHETLVPLRSENPTEEIIVHWIGAPEEAELPEGKTIVIHGSGWNTELSSLAEFNATLAQASLGPIQLRAICVRGELR